MILFLLLLNVPMFAFRFEDLYVNMPDSLNPLLSKQNRMELLAYYKVHQGDSILNRFKKKVQLLNFDTLNCHISVKNSRTSLFELKVFRAGSKQAVVAVINTVGGSVSASRIAFYDTTWHALPIQFEMPKSILWLNPTALSASETDADFVKTWLEHSFVSLSFDLKNELLVAKDNSLNFVGDEDGKLLGRYISDHPLYYHLVGDRWVLVSEP